ncbi:MAG: hypothetical protein Tsb0013_00120 [Phycisphaerales bacterium]
MAQYSPKKIIRNISKPLLKQFFGGCGLLDDFDWDGYKSGDPDPIMDAIEELSAGDQAAVETGLFTVSELATDGGSRLIYEEAAFWKRPWASELEAMANDCERAMLALKVERGVVFTKTKHGADKLAKSLERDGVSAGAIHGNRSQKQRERTLGEFRAGKFRVLVATDVAARGLDVDGITDVFNFNLPMEPEAYVHRIGRTGRAGAPGRAISFCSREERGLLRGIERLMDTTLEATPVPSELGIAPEDVRTVREARPARGAKKAAPKRSHKGGFNAAGPSNRKKSSRRSNASPKGKHSGGRSRRP